MGYWGLNSYEMDEAADALDHAYQQIHGERYDQLMDDRNPMSFDDVQRAVSDAETLSVACTFLDRAYGADRNAWDATARLALVGVVIRHREFGVAVPGPLRQLARAWLETEELDWEEDQPQRTRRRQREIQLLDEP